MSRHLRDGCPITLRFSGWLSLDVVPERSESALQILARKKPNGFFATLATLVAGAFFGL